MDARSDPGPDAVDEDVLAQLRALGGEDDPEFLATLVADFLAHAAKALRGLEAGLEARDAAALHEVAHGLKGSAGSLGATRLAALCAALDVGVRAGSLEGAREGVARIADEVVRVQGRLAPLLRAPR